MKKKRRQKRPNNINQDFLSVDHLIKTESQKRIEKEERCLTAVESSINQIRAVLDEAEDYKKWDQKQRGNLINAIEDFDKLYEMITTRLYKYVRK